MVRLSQKDATLFDIAYDECARIKTLNVGGKVISYEYNKTGKLMKAICDQNWVKLDYDEIGNLCSKTFSDGCRQDYTLLQSFSYDTQGLLLDFVDHTTTTHAVYTYDGFGKRVSQTITDAQGNTTTINDISLLHKSFYDLCARSINDENSVYITSDMGVLALLDDAGFHPILTDISGGILRTSDKGVFTHLFSRSVFGKEHTPLPLNLPFSQNAYIADSATHTLFAHVREYSPALGRFITPDVIGGIPSRPYTLNRYSYCANNPIRYVDMDGRIPIPLIIAGAVVAGAAVGAALSGGSEVGYEMAVEKKSWGEVDWPKAWERAGTGAIVGGAATALVIATGGTSLAAASIGVGGFIGGNALAGSTAWGIDYIFDTTREGKEIEPTALGVNVVLGGALNIFFPAIGAAIYKDEARAVLQVLGKKLIGTQITESALENVAFHATAHQIAYVAVLYLAASLSDVAHELGMSGLYAKLNEALRNLQAQQCSKALPSGE